MVISHFTSHTDCRTTSIPNCKMCTKTAVYIYLIKLSTIRSNHIRYVETASCGSSDNSVVTGVALLAHDNFPCDSCDKEAVSFHPN